MFCGICYRWRCSSIIRVHFCQPSLLGWIFRFKMRVVRSQKKQLPRLKLVSWGPSLLSVIPLFGAVIPTILGSLAAYMGMKGNPIGVIIWLLCAVVILGLRYFELPLAYREGKKLVSNVGNLLNNLTDAATLLGVFVIGGLIPTVVNVIVPFKLTIGKKSLAIQADMLDQILPALVPIALVALAYWLLGRKK